MSSCRLIFGKIHYPFTPSLFYSFTPPLPDSLLLYSLLPPYSLLLTTLLLTTYYSTTYYFLPYYSFLFHGITTFCHRQMGRNFRLYRIFVQYFVHERGSSFRFYSTKTINPTPFIGIFKIKTTSCHTKR